MCSCKKSLITILIMWLLSPLLMTHESFLPFLISETYPFGYVGTFQPPKPLLNSKSCRFPFSFPYPYPFEYLSNFATSPTWALGQLSCSWSMTKLYRYSSSTWFCLCKPPHRYAWICQQSIHTMPLGLHMPPNQTNPHPQNFFFKKNSV